MAETSSVIEQTIKALVGFESELERAKSEAEDSTKKLLKDADDWAQSAKAESVARAQELASDRLQKAREEAETEAGSIRKKGDASLKEFEGSISKRKAKGGQQVLSRLLGEGQ